MPQNGHRPFNIIVLVQKRKKLTALEKNPLQSKKQKQKKDACPFKLSIAFSTKTCRYYVADVCLQHENHILCLDPALRKVLYEGDVLPNELKFIKNQAVSGTFIAVTGIAMQKLFHNRSFSRDVIRRLHEKYRKEHYGHGQSVMPKFYDMGLCYERNGGKFKVLTASDGSLMFAIFSRPEMAAFINLYQDFMLLQYQLVFCWRHQNLLMVCKCYVKPSEFQMSQITLS
jgi:hypothetical protein